MPFHYDIEDKIRFIVVYQDVSKKPTVIQKYTKIGLRNIQRWIKDTEENINILERRPGSGRRPSIPDNVKSNITRTTRRKPSKSSTRKLSNKYQVSKNSAHRVLKEKKYKYKKPKSGKTLTSEEKADRVDYCEYMLNRNGKRINACFFSDEMGITLSDAHPSRVWNPPRKKVKLEYPVRDTRLNCWGAISSAGATSLHIYKGTLDADRYEKILQEHLDEMDEILPNGFLYQHDNLGAHTKAEDWMIRQGLDILDYPTYSPDLSPIENLWSSLKGAVAAENPTTERQLEASLIKNWEILTTVENLRPYFENLHTRYNSCIEEEGDHL